MLVSKNATETNKYELIVSIPADEFAVACDKVFKKRAKQFQVPGFRKGKAPRKTIEKLYGEGVFFEEAVNDAAPAAPCDSEHRRRHSIIRKGWKLI